jgi:hypothetical protein
MKYENRFVGACGETRMCYTVGMSDALARFLFHWTFPALFAVCALLLAAVALSFVWDLLLNHHTENRTNDR